MTMERTRPLAIHKRIVMLHLCTHPEDVKQVLRNYAGTAEDAIRELRDSPATWFAGGEFLTEDEYAARYPDSH
jgi:hypothetical protein